MTHLELRARLRPSRFPSQLLRIPCNSIPLRRLQDGTAGSDKPLYLSRRGRRPNGGYQHGLRTRNVALADRGSHSHHRADRAVASLNEIFRMRTDALEGGELGVFA